MADQNTDPTNRPPLPSGMQTAGEQIYSRDPAQPMQASDTWSAAGGSTGSGTGTQSSTIASVKESGGRIAGEARQYAGDMANRAKDKGRSLFEQQKESAVGQLGGVAHALRSTADQMQGDGQPQVARYIGMAADQLETLGDRLRNKDLDTLINDTQNLARRSPGAFLAGTVAVGFLLARFMKSSSERRRESTQLTDEGMYSASLPAAGTYGTTPVPHDSADTVLAAGSDASMDTPLTGAYDSPAGAGTVPGATNALDPRAGSAAGDGTPSSPKRSNLGDSFYGNR